MTATPDKAALAGATARLYPRMAPHLVRTPVVFDDEASAWLKCEQDQHTGSFKWRGALAKLSVLPRGSGVIAASTGNHGLAVAGAARIFGHRVTVYLPAAASIAKRDKLRAAGIELVEVPGDSLDAELAGKAAAEASGSVWVSPYNDPDVIAGQGTIGLEVLEQLPAVASVYITVGGGGLISGIAAYLKAHRPDIEIIGCQPARSREMYLSVLAGHVVDDPEAAPTLSDGSAGPLEPDSVTFPICRQLVDRWMVIPEEEIEDALRRLYRNHGMIVEGAAGVAYAAAWRERDKPLKGDKVVILCGGNIDPARFERIMASR
jgi:threonine dehydratase